MSEDNKLAKITLQYPRFIFLENRCNFSIYFQCWLYNEFYLNQNLKRQFYLGDFRLQGEGERTVQQDVC